MVLVEAVVMVLRRSLETGVATATRLERGVLGSRECREPFVAENRHQGIVTSSNRIEPAGNDTVTQLTMTQ